MSTLEQAHPLSPELEVEALIKEARRRQRRRRGGIAMVLLVLVAATLVVLNSGEGSHPPRSRDLVPAFRAGGRLERPDALLSRLPFMAVACHIPNSIACDRVGLAVWLRHPALSISATIAGEPLPLNNPDWGGPVRHGRRAMFAGFLHPAGIGPRLNLTNDPNASTWKPPPTAPLGPDTSKVVPEPEVQLRIEFASGKTVVTRLHVPLGQGWG